MQTVESLIRELQKFPPTARCYAYEGEVVGVVVIGPDVTEIGGKGRPGLGYVPCTESDQLDGPAIVD